MFPVRSLDVVEIVPPADAVAVPLDADVTVRFTRSIDPVTADAAALRLDRLERDGARNPVRTSIEIASDGRTVVLTPADGLAHNSTYELAVDPSIEPIGGESGGFAGATATFSTARAIARMDDARGDTFGTSRPANGSLPPDVIAVTAAQRQEAITITIELAAPMAEDDALHGVVELDVDQDPGTGFTPPAVDRLRPANEGGSGLGVEYGVEIDSDGVAAVFHLVGEGRTGEVRPRLEGRFLTLEIPYALIGDDDGNLDLALAVGTAVESTDVFPDDGSLRLGRGAELAARGVVVP